MSSVTSFAGPEVSVINMDAASAQLFEDCLAKLTAVVERTGQPLEELSNHPAVRPLMRKMRTLLNQMESFAALAEDNKDGSLATVTDISSRFAAN